jgi:F-type H+-transporting ATPase subunit epsilon
MEQNFKLEIITPYRVFYSGTAEMIVVNTDDGELGILAGHEPVVASVVIGPVKVQIDGAWKAVAMSDGFLEIEANLVTVLVGAAEWAEEIDVARAERSLKRATERLSDTSMPWVTGRAEKALKRAQTRLKVASGVKVPLA